MSFLRHARPGDLRYLKCAENSAMSFPRHAEIYRSDVGCKTQSRGRGTASRWSVPGPAKGRDGRTAPYPSSAMSFRTGYSLAGCSPAEPASASPVATSMQGRRNAGNDLSANGNLSLVSVSQWRGAVQSPVSQAAEILNHPHIFLGAWTTVTVTQFFSNGSSVCS